MMDENMIDTTNTNNETEAAEVKETTELKETAAVKEPADLPEKKKISFRKKDGILILVILCVAGLAFLLHEKVGGKGAGVVTVKVDGVLKGTYQLSKDQEVQINDGTNILKIKDGKADMVEADCPDKLCVNQKAVSLNHESIICLPNKVVVEVLSAEESEIDGMTN